MNPLSLKETSKYLCPGPAGRVCDKPATQEGGLDPWTAETSGKWPGGRKSPYPATAIKNTEERQ